MNEAILGTIISGSLVDGLIMKLAPRCSLEAIMTGKFVSIQGQCYRFFSLITDIELQVANPDILLFPPEQEETLLKQVLQQQDVFARVKLRPMLMLDKDNRHMPVKTIPSHFAQVFEAGPEDVAQIFGSQEDNIKFFEIGSPLDMSTPVCINLDKFSERSNGIFGKTGTGKTFITRLILAGLVSQSNTVNLVFDMHSEYGLQARKEGPGQSFVKGLKSLFADKVVIFSLDPASTRRRGGSPDFEVTLDYSEISVEDIMPLQDELNLHPTAMEAAYLIHNKFGRRWLSVLLAQDKSVKEFAEEVGAHAESIGALYRKLKQLERFSFLINSEKAHFNVQSQTCSEHKSSKTVIDELLNYLDRGINVVLEFGNHTSMLCYLLVANIITRRIHRAYVKKTERFLCSQDKQDEPSKLMITIEEAHKFLNPQAARQTIFGVIAREMRKYNVSLLVVDQRPSSIDQEVISQIGTKIVALLNDERDIQAVLTGVSNSGGLRSVLSTLDSKKQVLVLGHAVPMPVIIKTREYDETFYQQVGNQIGPKEIKKAIAEIF